MGNGVALDIKLRSLVGSQAVPYIYEDYAGIEETADAILKLYNTNKDSDEKQRLKEKCLSYVDSEFKIEDTIDQWHETLLKLVQDWRSGKRASPRFEMIEIGVK